MNVAYNDDPFANPGEPKRGQCVLHRNVWFKPDDFPAEDVRDEVRAFGVNQAALEVICDRIASKSLFIKGLTARDLSPLARTGALEILHIQQAHKFTDASPIAKMDTLRSLTLTNTKRWRDLSQLADSKVSELDISGGMNKDNVFETLAPLSELVNLRVLHMSAVKVEKGGLRPLRSCTELAKLNIAYTFDTEDYAYLAVHMPNTQCDAFHGIVTISSWDGRNKLVVGKRKPILSDKTDSEKLKKYRLAFEALKERFRSEMGAD